MLVPLFLLLPLILAGPAASPLFASCSSNQRCEGTAVCRFNICLPHTNPVPVYSHGNKTFTIQPKVNILGATGRPAQAINNYMIQSPKVAMTISVSCQPKCMGTASCFQGSCRCVTGIIYSPLTGCGLAAGGRPMQAVPIAPVRAIPQILPGERCDPMSECTGGSLCSIGICTCPPELVQQGRVCVAMTALGLPHRGLPGYQ